MAKAGGGHRGVYVIFPHIDDRVSAIDSPVHLPSRLKLKGRHFLHIPSDFWKYARLCPAGHVCGPLSLAELFVYAPLFWQVALSGFSPTAE